MQHTRRLHGVVKNVGQAYDDPDMADVEVEEPPSDKDRADHKKMKMSGKPHGHRHTHRMPKDVASHFAVDDAVEMEHTLRHYGRRRHSQADGGEREGKEKEK